MSVKILHAADFHLDSPFDALSEEKAVLRRREQRDLLDRIAALANDEQVQLVLLAGDLLDSATSYFETQEVLHRAFSSINAEIFIAPGNHDYYCPKSPYAYFKFPDNVHVFSSPIVGCFALPHLGCRVWGAGFNDPYSRPLLPGFKVPDNDMIDIMVLHGDTSGDDYNRVREGDITASELSYLALGHLHTFSGIRQAGRTTYAYPGCPEGRGFDETGDKGVIVGTVGKDGAELRFVPTGARKYAVQSVSLTGEDDVASAALAALPQHTERDIYKLILTGEFAGGIDTTALKDALDDRFFHLSVTDQTRPPIDIWADTGDDTLRGSFLRLLKERYDSADDADKAVVTRAVRYGLAALDNREEYEA